MRKWTQKKEETDQQTENLKLFLKTGNGPQMQKPIKKTENESNVNIAETDQKYSEIPQHFSVFKGFPIILEKKEGNGPKVTFGSVSGYKNRILGNYRNTQ